SLWTTISKQRVLPGGGARWQDRAQYWGRYGSDIAAPRYAPRAQTGKRPPPPRQQYASAQTPPTCYFGKAYAAGMIGNKRYGCRPPAKCSVLRQSKTSGRRSSWSIWRNGPTPFIG